ncbi:MAG: translin [Archaeoglobus sp.]|jgi:translin|nr:MAG: translin [Archaeoglobus sp.]
MQTINKRDFERIYRELEKQERKREELIKLCRELRINSTKAVAKAHAENIEEAEKHLEVAENLLKKILKYRKYPFYRSISGDAMQEYVEGVVFLSYLKGSTPPEFLEIDVPSILTGYADTVGEIRRLALDLMRKGKVDEAENCLSAMEEIYSNLIQFSFPEKLVPNLRHKVDLARNLIERVKSELLTAKLINLLKK